MGHRAVELERLFRQDNGPRNETDIEVHEASFLLRLEEGLRPQEKVFGIFAFVESYRDMQMRAMDRPAVLAVTDTRVIHLAGPKSLLAKLVAYSREMARTKDIEIISYPFDELTGVTGRKTMLSAGTRRELYFERRDGKYHKIQVFERDRSEVIARRVLDALAAHGLGTGSGGGLRVEIERLFRAGNPVNAGGSEATGWSEIIDGLCAEFQSAERPEYVAAFKNENARGFPPGVIAISHRRLFVGLTAPMAIMPRSDLVSASWKKHWYGGATLYLRTKTLDADVGMNVETANALNAALNEVIKAR